MTSQWIQCLFNITAKSGQGHKIMKAKRTHLLVLVNQASFCVCSYAPSQWEKALHCNAISHWLGTTQNDPCGMIPVSANLSRNAKRYRTDTTKCTCIITENTMVLQCKHKGYETDQSTGWQKDKPTNRMIPIPTIPIYTSAAYARGPYVWLQDMHFDLCWILGRKLNWA